MSLKNEKIMIHEHKRQKRQIRWLIFWVLLSLNVVTLAIEAVFTFMSPTVTLNYTRMMITQILAILLPLVIYFKVSGVNSPKLNLRLNSFSAAQAVMIVILAAAGQFIMIILNIPMTWLQRDIIQLNVIARTMIPENNVPLIFGVLVLAVTPAILEETLMRGVLFGGMEKQSTIFAAVFSTFVFALLHANPFNFVGYIFLGIMTVMVMLRTDSLYAAILFHFINNLTAFVFEFLLVRGFIESSSTIIFIVVCAIVVFIVSMFICRLITPNAPKHKEKNTMSLLWENIFSVPIILCIVLTVAVQYFRLFA